MLSNVPFWLKATVGLTAFALAPIYSVWTLAQANKAGTLQQPSKEYVERSFRNTLPKAR